MTIEYLSVGVVLLLAVRSDLADGRISNRLILTGILIGLTYRIFQSGPSGLFRVIIDFIWPILLLYPLFLIKGLGAGDIKLFSVISVFLSTDQMLLIILVAFITGAIISFHRIINPPKTIIEKRKIKFSTCIFLGFAYAALKGIYI